MNAIVLIFIYMANCIGVILFNIAYVIHIRHRERKTVDEVSRYSKLVIDALTTADSEKEIRDSQKILMRKLKNPDQMLSFEQALDQLWKNELYSHEEITTYIRPIFVFLAGYYNELDHISVAFFAHVVEKYNICRDMEIDYISPFFLSNLGSSSIYCRQNAMNVIYESRNVDLMMQAIEILNNGTMFLHEKTLTDGLLAFQGNYDKLIVNILDEFHLFNDEIKRTVIDYIRMKSGQYCEEIFGILQDDEEEKDVRLAALRYFGKYVYEPGKQFMIQLLQSKEEKDWEYSAVAASAIMRYDCTQVRNLLIDNLSHPNWYVRKNSAKSIVELKVPYKKIASVIEGNDRYAREALLYYWDRSTDD